MYRTTLILPLCAALLGCAVTPSPPSGAADPRADRLARLARPLLVRGPARAWVHVLDATEPAAYAWPDGNVYVSAGLLDRFDDAAVTAAIAHEFGHLADAPSDDNARPRTVDGSTAEARLGEEMRADRAGVELLRAIGADPADMPRMLDRLCRQPGMSHTVRAALAARIARLRTEPAP